MCFITWVLILLSQKLWTKLQSKSRQSTGIANNFASQPIPHHLLYFYLLLRGIFWANPRSLESSSRLCRFDRCHRREWQHSLDLCLCEGEVFFRWKRWVDPRHHRPKCNPNASMSGNLFLWDDLGLGMMFLFFFRLGIVVMTTIFGFFFPETQLGHRIPNRKLLWT